MLTVAQGPIARSPTPCKEISFDATESIYNIGINVVFLQISLYFGKKLKPLSRCALTCIGSNCVNSVVMYDVCQCPKQMTKYYLLSLILKNVLEIPNPIEYK